MQIKSTQKYLRVSPRKLRLVTNAIKGLTPNGALEKLKFAEKRAAIPVSKAIATAMANAKNNFKMDERKLMLKSVEINQGPTLKRGRPVSRGQYHQIKKRASHIRVILETAEGGTT